MDTIGWVIAAILGIFLTGLLVGLNIMSRRNITVNQSVSQSVEHTVNGGGCGSSSSVRAAPAIFPIMALGAVVAVFIATANAGINATNAVADTAARGVELQRETVKIIPTAAPPVIVQQPAPVVVTQQTASAPTFVEVMSVVSLAVSVVGVCVVVYAVRKQRAVKEQERSAWYASPEAQAPLTAREVFGQVDTPIEREIA